MQWKILICSPYEKIERGSKRKEETVPISFWWEVNEKFYLDSIQPWSLDMGWYCLRTLNCILGNEIINRNSYSFLISANWYSSMMHFKCFVYLRAQLKTWFMCTLRWGHFEIFPLTSKKTRKPVKPVYRGNIILNHCTIIYNRRVKIKNCPNTNTLTTNIDTRS